MLGAILKVGNCLNAGVKIKDRADGFYLEALAKASNIKGADGRTILQVVCAALIAEDEEFRGFKKNFEACQAAIKCMLDDVEKLCDKGKAELAVSTKRFG